MNAAAESLGTSSVSEASLQDVLTLILTTSPSPICPSTEMIETVLDSMAKHAPGVSSCRLIIVCDGAKVGGKEVFRSGRVTEASWASYAEYKQRLHARIQTGDAFGFRRAEVLELTEHHGFGFAVYAALQLVRTRLLCVVQHDRALLRPADVESEEVFSNAAARAYLENLPVEQRAKALVFGAPGRLVTKGAFLEAELAPRQLNDVVQLGLPHALAKWRTWLYDDGMGAPLVGHLNGAVAQPWELAEQKFGGGPNRAGQRWQRELLRGHARGKHGGK